MSEVKPMSDALVDAYIHDWPNDERTACNGIEVDADELLSMLTRIKSDRAIKAGLVEALKARGRFAHDLASALAMAATYRGKCPTPIPLEAALQAVRVAMEISKRDLGFVVFTSDSPAVFYNLALATYRSMLEYLTVWLEMKGGDIEVWMYDYAPVAALIAHLEATVPDWRKR